VKEIRRVRDTDWSIKGFTDFEPLLTGFAATLRAWAEEWPRLKVIWEMLIAVLSLPKLTGHWIRIKNASGITWLKGKLRDPRRYQDNQYNQDNHAHRANHAMLVENSNLNAWRSIAESVLL